MTPWKRAANNGLTLVVGPFVATVTPKGDGRWTWEIVADNSHNPQATGVAASAGAAKTVVEQFVKRSGRAD